MTDHTERHTQLTRRRQELTNRMSAVSHELDTHASPDWHDNAVLHEDDDMLQALGYAADAELRMIDAALARMDAGEYGECVECGTEIAPGRLHLLPATPFCASCSQGHAV